MTLALQRFVSTSVLACALLLVGVGCGGYRYAYSDTAEAEERYQECLEQNPVDPEVCEEDREDASEAYHEYEDLTQPGP